MVNHKTTTGAASLIKNSGLGQDLPRISAHLIIAQRVYIGYLRVPPLTNKLGGGGVGGTTRQVYAGGPKLAHTVTLNVANAGVDSSVMSPYGSACFTLITPFAWRPRHSKNATAAYAPKPHNSKSAYTLQRKISNR